METLALNRADLQILAEQRLLDAQALLDGGRWAFADYSAGYAIECTLKSCLLTQMIHTGWIFREKAKIEECLTHDFWTLMEMSGLGDRLNADIKANTVLAQNWKTVKRWKVGVRYELKTESDARNLHAAITDHPDGVLAWIKNYW